MKRTKKETEPRAHMLRKIAEVERSTALIAELLWREIKDEGDKARVAHFRRGMEYALRTLQNG